MEKFLINFVVEQTGYPPEVVELDADLEADLGIDSIKKAQLFGELSEYFDVQPTENMTLDDFPTLRHVMNFLVGSDLKKNLTPSQGEAPAAAHPAESHASPSPAEINGTAGRGQHPVDANETSPAEPPSSSSPAYAKGFDEGRHHRAEIRRALRRYADQATAALESPVPAAAATDPAGYFSADELAELEGLADAVAMPLASLVVHKWIAPPVHANGYGNGHVKTPAPPSAASGLDTPAAAPPAGSPRYDLDDTVDESTHRFVMTMFELPLEESVPAMPQWHGAALVIGNNPTADALRRLLTSVGVPVRSMEIGDDIDQTVAAFEKIWNEQPTPHVFLCSAHNADMASPYDEASWQRRWNRVVLVPYFLCQRFVQLAGAANMLKQCSLVATTALGGDFALSNSIPAPESAALGGLMKAIHVEVARSATCGRSVPRRSTRRWRPIPSGWPPTSAASLPVAPTTSKSVTSRAAAAWATRFRKRRRSNRTAKCARQRVGLHRRGPRHHGRLGARVGQALQAEAAPDRHLAHPTDRSGLA